MIFGTIAVAAALTLAVQREAVIDTGRSVVVLTSADLPEEFAVCFDAAVPGATTTARARDGPSPAGTFPETVARMAGARTLRDPPSPGFKAL